MAEPALNSFALVSATLKKQFLPDLDPQDPVAEFRVVESTLGNSACLRQIRKITTQGHNKNRPVSDFILFEQCVFYCYVLIRHGFQSVPSA